MLNSRYRRPGSRPARPRHTHRPRVERLEDRCVPTVQVLATLGDPAPGPGNPGFLINDFEPNGLNNKGEVIYGADLGTTSDPSSFVGEAIYLRDKQGQVTRLAGSTDAAPGTSTVFDGQGFFGPSSLNDKGDAALAFQLSPLMLPFGTDGGLFRYSHTTNAVTPVVVPFVTPAPGTGGAFQGVIFGYTLANNGDLAFDGLIPTADGIHAPGEDYTGIGEGIFLSDKAGHLSSVVVPGDAAPQGGTFDYAAFPWLNDGGDMAFEAHVAGDPLFGPDSGLYSPQAVFTNAPTGIYFRDGATGTITRIADSGYDPMMNNAGDIIYTRTVFDSDPADDGKVDELMRYSKGTTTAVAYPGESMPGGGHLVTISGITGSQKHINNQGDIAFNATLDTSTGGVPDEGLYVWSKGKTTLIARSGTVLPGVGTIAQLTSPANIIIGASPGHFPTGGAYINERGQVFFTCTLTDGTAVLLLLTPQGGSLIGGTAKPGKAAADPALLPASTQGSSPTDPGQPGTAAPSDSGATPHSSPPAGSLAALEQAVLSWVSSHHGQGDLDQLLALWGGIS